MFYGRGQRLSGTLDLAATADATITEPGASGGLGGAGAYRLGDVDGDGIADFVVRLPFDHDRLDARIVRGSTTRLAGAVALPDIGQTRLDDCAGPPAHLAGTTQIRPWLGPAGDVTVGVDVLPRLSLRASAELGVVAVGATARDLGVPVAVLAGTWTSLGVAAAIEL